MRVAGRVEVHHLALDRILRELEVEEDRLSASRPGRSLLPPVSLCRVAGRTGLAARYFAFSGASADFTPISSAVSARRASPSHDFDQERHRVVGQRHRDLAQAALLVGQRPADERPDVLPRQRLEGEDLAAREQRRVDREERVLRRRADQDDDPFFHVRQQHVLLCAVEAVDFVEEEDRPLAEVFEVLAGLGQDFADFLDAGGDRVHRLEAALGVVGDDVRERGLSGPRRAVEDQRGEAVGEQHSPEQLAGPEEVFLPDELVERSRPHPRRERPGLAAVLFAEIVEEVHDPPSPGMDKVRAKRHKAIPSFT